MTLKTFCATSFLGSSSASLALTLPSYTPDWWIRRKPSGLNTVLNIKAFEDGLFRIQQWSGAAFDGTTSVGGASNSR